MHTPAKRSGFTLIELLVAIAVIVVLATVTIGTLQYSAYKEQCKFAANDIATYLEGARNRAIMDRKQVGVMFLLDETGIKRGGNPVTVSKLMYCELPDTHFTQVSVSMEDQKTLIFYTKGVDRQVGVAGVDDPNPDGSPGNRIADDHTNELGNGDDVFTGTEFNRLDKLGIWGDSFFATINGLSFNVVRNGGNWQLTTRYPAGANNVSAHTDLDFVATPTNPLMRPGEMPKNLPKGIVIDLDSTRLQDRLPSTWYDGIAGEYDQGSMWIMFGPRGNVAGTSSAWGVITLLVAEAEAVETTVYNSTLYDPSTRGDNYGRERMIGISTATGGIRVKPINLEDNNGDGIFDDPFKFAEGGN